MKCQILGEPRLLPKAILLIKCHTISVSSVTEFFVSLPGTTSQNLVPSERRREQWSMNTTIKVLYVILPSTREGTQKGMRIKTDYCLVEKCDLCPHKHKRTPPESKHTSKTSSNYPPPARLLHCPTPAGGSGSWPKSGRPQSVFEPGELA